MSSRQLQQSSNSNQHQQQRHQHQQRHQQLQQQLSQQLSSQEPAQEALSIRIQESKQHPTLDSAFSSPSGIPGDVQSNFFFQRNRELARRWHSAHRHLLVDNSSSRNTSCTSSSNNDNAGSRQVQRDKPPPHPTTTEFIFAGGSGRNTSTVPSAFLFGKRGFAGISFQALRAAEANASALCPSSAATAAPAAGEQATLTAPGSKERPRRRGGRRRRSRRSSQTHRHETTAASSPSASLSSESEGASSDSTSTSSLLRRHRRHPQHPTVESDLDIQLRRKILTRFLCHPEDLELVEAAREIVQLELAKGLISLETEGEEEEEADEEEEGDNDDDHLGDDDDDDASSSASKHRCAIDVPRLPPIETRLPGDDSDLRPLPTKKSRSDKNVETMADPPPPRKEATNRKGKRSTVKGTAKTPREKKSRSRSENSQGDHVDRDRDERGRRRGDVDGNDRLPNANRNGANIGGDDATANADGKVHVHASVNVNHPAPHNPLSFFHPKGIPLHYAFSDPRFLQQFDMQRQLALKQLQQSTNPQQQTQMQQMQMQQQMRQQHNQGGNPSLPPGHRGQAFRQQQPQSQPPHAAQGHHHHQQQQRSNAAAIAAAFRQRGAVGSKAVAEVARVASHSFPPRAATTHRHRMASPEESSAHSGNWSRGSSSRLPSRGGTPNDVPPGAGHRGQGHRGNDGGDGVVNNAVLAKTKESDSDRDNVNNGSNDRNATSNNGNKQNSPSTSDAAASAIENLIGMKHYHLRQEALQRCAMTNPLLYERLHALEMERRMAVEAKERERERERERDDPNVRIGATGNAISANPSVLAGIAGGVTSAGNGYFGGTGGAVGGLRHRGFVTGGGVDIAGLMATKRPIWNDGGVGDPSETVVDYGRVGTGEAKDVISIADSDDERSDDGGQCNVTETMGHSKGVAGSDACEMELVDDAAGDKMPLAENDKKSVAADVNDRSVPNAASDTADDGTAIASKLTKLNKFTPLKQSDKVKKESEGGNASASESKTHATVTVNADSEKDSGRASAEQKFSANRPHSNTPTHGTSHASLMNSPEKRKTPESSSQTGISNPLEQAKRAKLDTESIQKVAQKLQQHHHQQQEQHPRAAVDSSPPQMTLPTTTLKDQVTASAVNTTNTTGSEKAAAALADIRIDPTFVQMIVAASKESMARRNAQSTGEMSQDALLGTFSRGLLSMDDEVLKQSLEDKNDQSNRICISNIIAPGLGIPNNLFNNTDGRWEGYVHVSSDHVMQFSKHIVYQRRKSMKSAVEVACDEMKKKHTFLMNEQMARFQLTIDSQNERIKQLEEQLENERGVHKKQMEALEELHLADTDECEKEQRLFFENMLKAHAEEVKALKDEMKNAENSNTELINMYLSASCDTLRLLEKDRKNNL